MGDFERSVVCLSFSKHGSNHLVAIDEGSDHTMVSFYENFEKEDIQLSFQLKTSQSSLNVWNFLTLITFTNVHILDCLGHSRQPWKETDRSQMFK